MHSCRDRDISANFLSCGGDVLAEFDPFETFYAVMIPLSGKVASQRVCVAPGRAPLRFESPMDGGDYAMSWYRLLRFMIDELDRSGSLLETAAKARVFEHHLVTLLLEIQSHNYAHALDLTNLREVRVRRGRGGVLGAERRGDR